MADYTSPEHHPAFEEYCECIFELCEDGTKVIQARIAERLGVSRPAVSEMIKKLQEEKLVKIDGQEIVLTSQGHTLASVMVRRHRLAERFLTDILGLSWAQAHHEAGKWEHVISPEVEKSIVDKLSNPTTCPHGNPIPGSGYVEPAGSVSLATIQENMSAIICRITEELEFAPGTLEYLEQNKIIPSAIALVKSVGPDGTLNILIDNDSIALSKFISERILVQPV